ncbi:methenyltetrahydromethanopterin cyclohydrolase [Stieleria tagensis]|uniref:methenyltetrahydromethanopterin cyclohydrolase n=1 Tax=Stieleria tagensis TaxID=2956795 RepID=UPI0021BCF988|nr:methenyltetrahydromethanopterin cyclohydrolase [Stieleria tagensis]
MHDPIAESNHSPNRSARDQLLACRADRLARVRAHTIAGATVIDFGLQTPGSLRSGRALAQACMGGLSELRLSACDAAIFSVANAVHIHTDAPVLSCLGCQYAGWPVSTEDYFAMGSGPMRLLRGKEEVLIDLQLVETETDLACGVIEADALPPADAIEKIAHECDVETKQLTIGLAPSTSIAGSIQIVARSVETAMHKLHALRFDVTQVVSASGTAPLPPPAKPGQSIAGIGRTNDAMLYGAEVTLWVDCPDHSIESVLDQAPSSASPDHGRPFKEIFASYDHDFYKVDSTLFSPAVVRFHNLRSGRSFAAGRIEPEIMRESFTT